MFLLLVAVPSLADTIYVDGSDGNLYTIDPLNGATTLVGSMGIVATDIAMYNGAMFATNFPASGDASLYGVDPNTGASTLIGTTGVYINALEFGPDGTLYGAGGAPGCGSAATPCNSLYSINTTTGAATLIGTGTYDSAGDLSFAGTPLYLTSFDTPASDALYQVDPTTGLGTFIGDLGFADVFGLAYDSSSAALYGFNDLGNNVLSINTSTGAAMSVATYSGNFEIYGATTNVAPTPEPKQISFIAAGLLVLFAFARASRKRRLDSAMAPGQNKA